MQMRNFENSVNDEPVIASSPGPSGIPRSMNGCDMLSLDSARQDGKAWNGTPSVSSVYVG